MQNIIKRLDFLKGKKTLLSSIFTIFAVIFNANGIDFTQEEMTQVFYKIINELEVVLGALGIIYGLVMKVLRKFN